MKKIAFSGTLDPITNGHMWVIGEARSMADEVIVFLSENPAKRPQFSAERRQRVIEDSAAERGWDNVKVVLVKGDFTARAAKRHGIDYIIRGIRNTSDFDYENLIQQTNVDVLHGAKTIFVMPPRDLGSVSSSFVRALQGPVGWHWIVKKFVPPAAYAAWLHDWLRTEWETLWCYAQADPATIANADHWFDALTGPTSYDAPARQYHNLDHLVHGLTEIRGWSLNTNNQQGDADLLRKAFWFHDAVYGHENGAVSNEEASARLWLGSGLGNGPDSPDDPADLIRATAHGPQSPVTHRLQHVICGIDLAILGQDDDVYAAYAAGIRVEYAHVADAAYSTHRCQIIKQWCARAEANELYPDAYFAEQYNQKAQSNMQWEIAALSADQS